MEPRTNSQAQPTGLSRRARVGIGIGLLALVIGAVIYFARRGDETVRSDPNIGKETGVTIEGMVTCNGELMPGGYVIAWQGPPVAYGPVQADGSYKISSAPLGKSILTFSAIPPGSAIPKLDGEGPGGKDFGPPPKDKDFQPKDKAPPKDKGPPPKDKDFPPKDKFHAKDKDMGPKDQGFFGMKGDPFAGQQRPLTPTQKQLVDRAGRKYRDPVKKVFEINAKKGTNSLDLSLTVP